ncbi:hypothetical protein [Candidatus Bandiella euplotis]|nr:hypothetical protein [Candidatus Bandiella woodruffii]
MATLPEKESHEELDMGTIFDFFDESSHTETPIISDLAKKPESSLRT